MADESIKYAGIKLQVDGAAEFQKSLQEISKGMKTSSAELAKTTAEFGKNSKGIEALTAKQTDLQNKLSLNKQEQQALNEMLGKAEEKYGENSREVETLKLKLLESETAEIRMQKALNSVSEELKVQQSGWTKLGESLTDSGKKLQDTGKKMSDVGGSLTKGVTAPLLAAGAGLVAVGAQFDDAYDKIRIGTGATGDALQGLQDDFKAVAASVPASFDEVSTAIADYNTRLDLSSTALQELSAQTINLSKITGADLGSTIESTSQTFKAFNVSSEDYGESLDYIFKVSQSTGIEFTRLQDNLTKFSPALKQLGLGFKESSTLMGMMDKAGVDVEASMGALNKAVVNMAKSGVTDANEAIKLLMDQIKNAPTDMKATSLAMEIFGAKGGVGMATAIREGKLSFEELMATLEGSNETINGVANETYDWAESFEVLKNQLMIALEPLAGQFFDAISGLVPLVQEFVGWITDLVTGFTSLDEGTQKVILIFAGIAAAIGPILSGIGTLITVVGTITSTFGALSASVGAAGGLTAVLSTITPVILPIAGVFAGVVAAGVLLYQNWDLVKEKAKALLDYLKPTFDEIKTFFTGWAKEVYPIFSNVFEDIKKIAENIFNALKDFWNKWGNTIKTNFETLFNNVKIIVSTTFEVIKTVINTALKIIGDVINVFTSILKGDWRSAWDSIKNIFSTAWEGIKSVASTLLSGLLDLFRNSISCMVSIGADIIGGLISGLQSKSQAVKDTVINMISGFTDSIKSFFGIHSPSRLMKEMFGYVGDGMIVGLESKTNDLMKVSKDISDGVTDNLKIDTTDFIADTKDVVDHMNKVLPEFESKINLTEANKQKSSQQNNTYNYEGLIKGNTFVVREESDIVKIAKEVVKQINQSVSQNNRIGGGFVTI